MYLKKASLVSILAATVAVTAVSVVSAATSGNANLLGNVDHAQWADASHLIASQETETGRIDFMVDASTGTYAELLNAPDASDLVVSPSGKKAAYTNAAGEVFVIDLASKASTKVSADINIKPELVWSSDEASLFFLQGDKGSVINKLTIADGKITKVLEDKVDYKANLNVSTNGTIFTYTVTKPGAFTAPADSPVENDDITLDMTGTEPQIYTFDTSVKDGKPVRLTGTAEDKVFIQAYPDASRVAFVRIPNYDDAAVLVSVGPEKVAERLFAVSDVIQAEGVGNKWYVLAAGATAKEDIYEVDLASGNTNKLHTVDDTVSSIIVKAGSPIATVKDGAVYVESNGAWKQITN